MGFAGRPRVDLLEDGRMVELVEDFVFIDKAGIKHTAREGLHFDGKSTPRGLWWTRIAGPPLVGKARYAAVIHDQERADVRAFFAKTGDKEAAAQLAFLADRAYLEGMECSGVWAFKRKIQYKAVRAGSKWEAMRGYPIKKARTK